MKIAQVAPLYEAVPPKLYGGTERVVHFLTEELVKQGHDVTLFASGDSKTSARLVAHVDEALRLDMACEDTLAPHIVQMQEVIERAHQFDFIHFHTDYLHYPFSSNMCVPHLTTLHGKLSIPQLQLIYKKFPHQPVVSISDDQRTPIPDAHFLRTIHHGLPADMFSAGEGDGGYLAFLGRISPEKRPDRAIEMAIAAGIPLKIAAKIDKADKEYFEKKIQHLFDHPLVEYVGEINDRQKQEFLGNAKALLFPIDWCEPFGIVMIEAMACGTPVIAWNIGSVPEVIENGVTGFIINSLEEGREAIRKIEQLDRQRIRKAFMNRFTAERMAKDYVRVYQQLIDLKEQEYNQALADERAVPILPVRPVKFVS